MDKLKSTLKKVESSKEFKAWEKGHKSAYFSYAFSLLDESVDWQVGFYDPKTDKITTFAIKDNCIFMHPEEEVFKKEETKVNKLELEKIKIGTVKAAELAEKFQSEKHPKENPTKAILILQNLGKLGDIWNITYVTQAFNTLNMKISAKDGKVIEHTLTPLMDFTSKG